MLWNRYIPSFNLYSNLVNRILPFPSFADWRIRVSTCPRLQTQKEQSRGSTWVFSLLGHWSIPLMSLSVLSRLPQCLEPPTLPTNMRKDTAPPQASYKSTSTPLAFPLLPKIWALSQTPLQLDYGGKADQPLTHSIIWRWHSPALLHLERKRSLFPRWSGGR